MMRSADWVTRSTVSASVRIFSASVRSVSDVVSAVSARVFLLLISAVTSAVIVLDPKTMPSSASVSIIF